MGSPAGLLTLLYFLFLSMTQITTSAIIAKRMTTPPTPSPIFAAVESPLEDDVD
jgi:hypothetical protein